ncbi:MAG: hypothetical protein R3E01_21495 [Pirellulaceae bacterium]|nr:hypothetical protein [Planctomycetales bacterium]
MTLLGKVCIVIIFVMSVLFMGLSMAVYATHRNWRDAVTNPTTGLQQKLQLARNETEQKTNEITELQNSLEMERAARRQVLAVNETRARQYRDELTTKEKEFSDLQAQHQQAIATLAQAEDNNQRLKQEVSQLRDEILTAQADRDKQLANVIQLTDTNNQRQGVITRLTERNQELEDATTRMTKVMRRNGLSPADDVERIPEPVEGRVTMVRSNDLIEVDLGWHDGVKKGHTLDVYRGNGVYVGRIIVTDTNPDRSVGKVVPQYLQEQIQEGDHVTTKLG